MFWLCFGTSVLTLVAAFQAYDEYKATYYNVKEHGGSTEPALIKLLGTSFECRLRVRFYRFL